MRLVALLPRDEGEAVHGDPVRSHRDHLVERSGEGLRRLQRQPVDQVDVDAVETALAAVVEEIFGLLVALVAVHDGLDLGREVLHTHAQPVEAHVAQRVDVRVRGHARIDLDRHLGFGQDLEAIAHRLVEPSQLFRGVVGRRAAAPVVLRDLAPVRQMLRHEVDLAVQVVHVLGGALGALGDRDVAAAEGTALVAEGQMEIEGQRLVGQGIGLRELVLVLRLADAVVELDRRRVRRVARAGPVVLAQQLGRDRNSCSVHLSPECGALSGARAPLE